MRGRVCSICGLPNLLYSTDCHSKELSMSHLFIVSTITIFLVIAVLIWRVKESVARARLAEEIYQYLVQLRKHSSSTNPPDRHFLDIQIDVARHRMRSDYKLGQLSPQSTEEPYKPPLARLKAALNVLVNEGRAIRHPDSRNYYMALN